MDGLMQNVPLTGDRIFDHAAAWHGAREVVSRDVYKRQVFRSFSRLLERGTLTYDVSAGQWRFLRQLWREDGITQRELSERVGMREPTTVVALKGLEKAGFITRKKTSDDRRKTFIHLTPHARKLELILAPMNAEVHEIAARGMTDEEVETLQALMRRVIENLADETAKLSTLSLSLIHI